MNPATLAAVRTSSSGLFAGYRPPADTYDELLDASGALRPGLQPFVELLDALGAQELGRRWEQARRIIREDGVTYNVHGDPQGRDRRWELDPLPLVLGAADWSALSVGLVQRAELLNAILVDVYGPGHLVRERLLPPELIAANPNFLRPCHGWQVPRNRYLHLVAAHIGRAPTGQWCVLADRTQAPAGLGYAVENRIVVSRMIPHIFHHCHIQRLAGFFFSLRDTLGSLAERPRDGSRTVLLSAGPASDTYFEDSYLARYLGYDLVEGEDLTVRSSRVFLKTLVGLVGVDTIFRRRSDFECDPLELDGRAANGIASMTHAARRGHVAIANALGSGWLESPALAAFLPALCRRLLAQDLKLASAPTWWCGDKASLSHVLTHLENLIIRSAAPDNRPAIDGASLSRSERDALAGRIAASPADYAAQERVQPSTAPMWCDNSPRSGHLTLRTFLVASGDSYQVMPGALAHVAQTGGSQSSLLGEVTKDVWIVAEGPVSAASLLPAAAALTPRRSGQDLPSRVADNLFWLGQYVERAEGLSRLLRAMFTRLTSEASPGDTSELAMLFASLALAGPPAPAPGDDRDAMEHTALAALYDAQQPRSLRSLLDQVRRVATAVRDRMSLDTWRILQRIENDFQPGYPLGVVSLADVLSMLNQMIVDFSAFSGGATENMTRGPGWQFLELGRRIERALATIAHLRAALSVPWPNEHAVLEALLEIADSSMTYRHRYATNLQTAPFLDLLVSDELNPRSIGYQLAALSEHVACLPRQAPDGMLEDEERAILACCSALRLADVSQLAELDEHGLRQNLIDFLQHLAAQLAALSSAITNKYLVHAGPTRQL